MLFIYVSHFSENHYRRSNKSEQLRSVTKEKLETAKAAFNNAVNDGEDANALYMGWKAVKDELDMLQAQLEALAHSGIGKQVPQLAKQMKEEADKLMDSIAKAYHLHAKTFKCEPDALACCRNWGCRCHEFEEKEKKTGRKGRFPKG
jgi:isopenicillin N synthase-like dioxygenase